MTRAHPLAPAAAVLLGLLACSNAGKDLGVGTQGKGIIQAQIYYDRDGSGTFNAFDGPVAGVRTALVPAGTLDTLFTAVSNPGGLVQFLQVPVGSYSLVLDTTTIGDSLRWTGVLPTSVSLTASSGAQAFFASLAFPTYTVAAARALPPGTRVQVPGVILSGRQQFRDTTAHIADGSGAIRLLDVRNFSGALGNSSGDSVLVFGTLASRNNQPVIALAAISTVTFGPLPVPDTLTSQGAATASGGSRDAALVHVAGAAIVDTLTVAPDFVMHVDDGSGLLEVVIDGNLTGFIRSSAQPGLALTANGVLVPDSTGAWRLKPRTVADITIN